MLSLSPRLTLGHYRETCSWLPGGGAGWAPPPPSQGCQDPQGSACPGPQEGSRAVKLGEPCLAVKALLPPSSGKGCLVSGGQRSWWGAQPKRAEN